MFSFKWFLKSPSTRRAIGFLVIGAAVMCAMVAIILHTQRDRCFRPIDGCTEPARWPAKSVPLFVSVDPESEADWEQANDDAEKTITAAVPDLVFSAKGGLESDDAGVVAVHAAPSDVIAKMCPDAPEGHGCTRVNLRGCTIVRAEIFVPSETKPGRRTRVLVHEILHAFLLDHDDNDASAMYPVARATPYAITASDAELLGATYAH